MHVFLVKFAVKHLQVTASAVDILLMLDCELHDEVLAFVGEGLELARKRVESRILRGLQAYAQKFLSDERKCLRR